MPLRVLHIIPTLERGGAAKQMCVLATGLPSDRFDVHVCALHRAGPLQADLFEAGVSVTFLGQRWRVDSFALSLLYRLMRDIRPDIVHTWTYDGNCYGRAAAMLAGVPHIVAEERCVDRWKLPYQFWIDRLLARRTERVVTNSNAVRDFYVKHGLSQDRFTVIANGVEPARAPSGTKADFLAELGIPPNARIVGSVSRLERQKRLKDLMWALDLVGIVYDDVHLVIVGEGSQRWRLERFRGQMERNDRIHFLGARDDASQLLAHFDVFCLPSAYEGQSNAALEAMAAGVPVVASDIAENREWIASETTGLLAPLGDRGALARQIRRILDDRELAKRLSASALARVTTAHGVDLMVAKYIDLYESMTAQGPRNGQGGDIARRGALQKL